MADKQSLINKILNKELDMFLSVPAIEPAKCQESPEGFRFMRGITFETWSEATLESYLGDLEEAKKAGRNLMTEKYVRMENLIPRINSNPLIERIVQIESDWQEEMRQKYPHLIGRRTRGCFDNASGYLAFETYLQCELETYSDRTLEFYYQDCLQGLAQGRRPREKIYERVLQNMGYTGTPSKP
jgi:hypothetical protein